jgi:hypothetical protein
MGDLVDKARFADSGLADDRHHLPMAGGRTFKGELKLLHLGITSNEPRETAGRRGLQPGTYGASADELVHLHRRFETLDWHRTFPLDLDVTLDELERSGAYENSPRIRQLLHAGGEMRGLADCCVVHVQIRPDCPHDNFTGIEAHADSHCDAVRVEYFVAVLLHTLLHPQRGIASPYRLILVGEGSPKQGHDPVAHDLIDRPLEAVDGLHHAFEHRVEELARLLRVAIGEQLHRALEVGKEHGDLLALALERCLRGQNLLGEVLGRVDLGRGEAASVSDY